MEKAYSYRFYPTKEQEILLRKTIGCVRLVYNKALSVRTESWYNKKEKIDYSKTSSMLTEWKKQEELSFLNEVSSVPIQQSLRHLQNAFKNFFDGRSRYPNFKKKRSGGSAEFTKSAFRFKNNQIFMAKCHLPLNIRWSRQLPCGVDPTSITIRLNPSQQWYISINFDDLRDLTLPKSDNAVGIDLGINSLLTLSNGEKISNPKYFTKHHPKLKKAQKVLARKKKNSKNRDKARIKVAKIHQKISNCRKDHIHKVTTKLIRENQTIALETLSVKNMVKNNKLSKAISDASWGEIVSQLEYKAKWYGRNVIKIDRWFPSSKRCGNCGFIIDKLPLNIREWNCPKCGTNHDRDVNAAKNILAAGHAVNVCGANIRLEGNTSGEQLRNTRKRKKQKI